MSAMRRIHLLQDTDAPVVAPLRKALGRQLDELQTSLTIAPEADAPDNIHMLIAARPTAALLQEAVRLQVLQVPFAGIPAATRDLLRNFPAVAVHNLHHNDAPTAELAVALMLAVARSVPSIHEAFLKDGWAARELGRDGVMLDGRNAVILGYGAIGRRVALACLALGMQVTAVRRTCPEEWELFLNANSDGVMVYEEATSMGAVTVVCAQPTIDALRASQSEGKSRESARWYHKPEGSPEYDEMTEDLDAVIDAAHPEGSPETSLVRSSVDPARAQLCTLLRTFLKQADVLQVCLPDTPDTDGLISARELEALPSHAILVNTGRAAVVNEEALYRALETGRLLGAGLDVWYRYPQPGSIDAPFSNRPFATLANVVASPHRGGVTRDTEERRAAHLAAQILAFARNGALPNRVDLGRGY